MRWTFIGILVIYSQIAHAWYPEFGHQLSGVGSYDLTGQHFLLIAFNRNNQCHSVSLLLDESIFSLYQSEKNEQINIELEVDNYRSWAPSFEIVEFDNWLPYPKALKHEILPALLSLSNLHEVNF